MKHSNKYSQNQKGNDQRSNLKETEIRRENSFFYCKR